MPPTVALIDYGSGNLRSAEKALARAASDGATGHDIAVTADATRVLPKPSASCFRASALLPIA